jgi:hypothetical protein
MTVRTDRGTSTTAEVVAELVPHVPPLRCCRVALLEGMRLATGPAGDSSGPVTTRLAAARAAIGALHADGVAAHVVRRRSPRRPRYAVVVGGATGEGEASSTRNCCARSRLRGAFLAAGSVSRPDAAAHLEMLCASRNAADVLRDSCTQLGIDAAVLSRRGHWLVAARSVEAVAATLSSIGAQHGRIRFEEGRVLREMRAAVNRRINSETANLRRLASASVRHALAVELLHRDPARWDALPPALREAGLARRRHPQDSLDSLAARVGCSRSAMAGRLRRLLLAAGTGGSLSPRLAGSSRGTTSEV